MLMRSAKTYSSSCSQIAVVYLQPFRRNSLLWSECWHSRRLKKNNITPHFSSSGSFKVIDADTTKKLVTSACCMPMPICNHFRERLANNGKIMTFVWGYHSLMLSCACFHEPKRLRFRPLKSTFNAENFICSLS